MEKELRNSLMVIVREAVENSLEGAEEKWLNGDQLVAQFGCFTKAWLKTYGHTLPRTRAIVSDDDGNEHKSGWCYPLHKINRMLLTGTIKQLKNAQL